MRNKTKTAKSSLIWVILLSALYAIIGEIIFLLFYYHDYLLKHDESFMILLSIIYIIPVVLYFRSRYWYYSLFILLFYIVFSIVFLFLFSALFPLPDDNPAGGILAIIVHGINIISIVIGVFFGLLINLSLYYWLKLDDAKEIND
ncbi:hypothetical protein ASG89_33520 [Paenibacillus sp. Soil766]|nr:hypothetical protein ASG89_33520 [Paenibacillus sp. Soil766]